MVKNVFRIVKILPAPRYFFQIGVGASAETDKKGPAPCKNESKGDNSPQHVPHNHGVLLCLNGGFSASLRRRKKSQGCKVSEPACFGTAPGKR